MRGTDECTPGDTIKGVARGTDFAVDLEAAAEARRVLEVCTWYYLIEVEVRLVVEGLGEFFVLPRVLGGV